MKTSRRAMFLSLMTGALACQLPATGPLSCDAGVCIALASAASAGTGTAAATAASSSSSSTTGAAVGGTSGATTSATAAASGAMTSATAAASGAGTNGGLIGTSSGGSTGCANQINEAACLCDAGCAAGEICTTSHCEPPARLGAVQSLAVVEVDKPDKSNSFLVAIATVAASSPSSVELLDVVNNRWFVQSQTLPVARSGVAAAIDGNGNFFVAGGLLTFPDGGTGDLSSEVDTIPEDAILNSKPGGWTASADLPVAVANAQAIGPTTSQPASLFGGLTDGGPTAAVQSLNPSADAWTVSPSALPTPLSGAMVVFSSALTDGGGSGIVVLGGQTAGELDAGTVSPDTWLWMADGGWQSCDAWPNPRLGTAATADAQGLIYVIGGQSDGGPSTEMDIYTPGGSWSAGPSLPRPLTGLICSYVVVDHRIYCLGGSDAEGPSDSVLVYLIDRGLWVSSN